MLHAESVVESAMAMSEELEQNATASAVQTNKDDIARLLHLYKEPIAQRHWTDLYSILSRPELDARKSGGEYGIAANPLASLAELFNDYDNFSPQNLMVRYATPAAGGRPSKVCPYQASASEWSYLATFTHELDPSNVSRKNIIRGPDWIKTQWADVRKNLHQMFVQYNRSGQHDADMDEWGSEKECRRWARAASWRTPGSNSVIRFQQAMIYSICLFDICDFESIGRKMPKGTGVDCSLNDTGAPKHKAKKRVERSRRGPSSSKKNKRLANAILAGSRSESKISALRLILEFGDEGEKLKAKNELQLIAFGNIREESEHSLSDSDSDEESLLCDPK